MPHHLSSHLRNSTPLPIWMNVSSLSIWLSDFHTAQFSDGSGCYWFWDLVVILSMVAWGGEACLPMPPSWPEVHNNPILNVLRKVIEDHRLIILSIATQFIITRARLFYSQSSALSTHSFIKWQVNSQSNISTKCSQTLTKTLGLELIECSWFFPQLFLLPDCTFIN